MFSYHMQRILVPALTADRHVVMTCMVGYCNARAALYNRGMRSHDSVVGYASGRVSCHEPCAQVTCKGRLTHMPRTGESSNVSRIFWLKLCNVAM
jgi:hypothetical protein